MSFFDSSTPEEAMGTVEEREEQISKIISQLGLSTLGELIWIQRNLERNLNERQEESTEKEINLYEKKKQEIADLMKEHKDLISNLSNLQREKESNEVEIVKLKTDLKDVITEKKDIETERDFLAKELERISVLYKELTGSQASREDLRDLLGIYITLMEEVFSGKAHFKVLSILHGEKMGWKREEIAKSTGISEIQLRQVLGELARAGILTYDVEHATVKLLKQISTLD